MSIFGSHRRRKRFPTRWSSDAGGLSYHEKERTCAFEFLLISSEPVPNFWAYFCLGLSHSKPNAVPSHSNFSAAPPGYRELVQHWALATEAHAVEPYLAPFFLHAYKLNYTPCFANALLLYLFLFLFYVMSYEFT